MGYDDNMLSISPLYNDAFDPSEDEMEEMAIDELEEAFSALSRRYEELLEVGKTVQAKAVLAQIKDIEEMLMELEKDKEDEFE